MNKTRIALEIGMVLLVLAAYTVPVVAEADVYFDPDPSTIGIGETATIQLMWHVDANESGARSFQIGIDFDSSVVNVTEVHNPCTVESGGTCYAWQWPTYSDFIYYDDPIMAPIGGFIWTTGSKPACYGAPITVPIINLTVVGVSAGTCPLIITHEIRAEPSWGWSLLTNCTDEIDPDKITWTNGTVECVGLPETFEKELVLGWNLISLPLTPVDNSTSAVLGNGTFGYNVVYRYDATAKLFECPSTMDPGIGYFVNVTTAGTWNYTGTAYTSMTIDLKQGLNCIGWVNTSADLPDAMSSISGNYRYVAGWDADDSKYGVYDANAPVGVPEFIDFTTMARGNGYWIAAKEDCTLNV
ncbi:MAG: hypothetical protein U9Q37_07585 [Euryarchaeota archaeon]|nr:hypothetical protein [Euryarchaeota archaeon]